MYNLVQEDDLKKVFECEISHESINIIRLSEMQKIATTANIPGFRKGHVPISVVEKQYGQNVRLDAINKLVNDTISDIQKESNLKLVTSPEVDLIGELEDNKPVKFRVSFNLWPSINELDYSKIKLTALDVVLSEEDYEKSKEAILRQYAEKSTTDSPAKSGDLVIIDFEGFIDESPLAGGKAEKFELELGSNSFIPGFEDQLIGHSQGEEFDINLSFPDDYHEKSISGKPVKFKIKLHEVKQVKLPDINQDLLQKLQVDSVEAFDKSVRDKMSLYYQEVVKNVMKTKVFDAVKDLLDFKVPDVLLDNRQEQIAKKERERNERAAEFKQKTESEIIEYSQKEALKALRLSLFLMDLSDKNNIKPTDEEVMYTIMEEARNSGANIMEVINYYRSNEQALESIKNYATEKKIYDFIYDKINFEKKLISREELEQAIRSKDLESLI